MIDIQLARKIVIDNTSAITQTECVDISHASGRTLARKMKALNDRPPHNISMMDGFAIHENDLTNTTSPLRVIDEVKLTSDIHSIPHLTPQHCIRVFTGSSLPPNTAAVIMKENTQWQKTTNTILLTQHCTPQQNIKKQGSDFSHNETLLTPKNIIDFHSIALLAAMNCTQVEVFVKARVGLIVIGDEFVNDNQSSDLPNINGLVVVEMLRKMGATSIQYMTVGDDVNAIVNAISKLKHCNLIITSGGASVGNYDFSRQAILQLNGQFLFHKIAVKPGKPCFYANLPLSSHPVPLIGLPGNPVSATLMTFLLVSVAMQKLNNTSTSSQLPLLYSTTLHDIPPNNSTRDIFIKAKIENNQLSLLYKQDSSDISILPQTNALIYQPKNSPLKKKFSTIPYLLFTL